MRWLLKHGSNASDQADRWGRTPLHQAAYTMELGAVQVLLEYKQDINLKDTAGYTPLNDVLAQVDPSREAKVVEIVRRLLEHGADPNVRLPGGSTALHEASSWGSPEVARLLLSYGANIDEKDEAGETPFQVASSRGHDEIMKLLLEQGAVPP